MGRAIGWGTINADTDGDLVIGEGGTTDPSTWVVFQNSAAVPALAFDVNVTSTGLPFNSARLQVLGTSGFGTSIRVADVVTGDMAPEIIVGDDINSQVRIYR
jgi:hypothetical protein